MNSILLHSTQGGSDKVYLLKIVQRKHDSRFEYPTYDVIYANGRRSAGATAGNKAKNSYPLTLGQANNLVDELKSQKMLTKGYHEMGGCSLCGGSTSTRNKPHLIATNRPEAVPIAQEQKELVKTFAPTWYERTIAFDDEDL